VYRTKDERWIAIAGSTQALTERLFREMGRPELIEDPRFRTNRDRVANVEALDEIVAAWVAERTQAECIEQLVKAEVAIAPVADFEQLAHDPHLVARKTLVTIDDPDLGALRMPDVLPKLSETPGRIRFAGLPMGVHNDEIYRDRLGLTEEEVRALKADGVI
jgi:crotonobetainyl-CoA:carnitine CoA-transferase CaiB-like acyl-CoA transferase